MRAGQADAASRAVAVQLVQTDAMHIEASELGQELRIWAFVGTSVCCPKRRHLLAPQYLTRRPNSEIGDLNRKADSQRPFRISVSHRLLRQRLPALYASWGSRTNLSRREQRCGERNSRLPGEKQLLATGWFPVVKCTA